MLTIDKKKEMSDWRGDERNGWPGSNWSECEGFQMYREEKKREKELALLKQAGVGCGMGI